MENTIALKEFSKLGNRESSLSGLLRVIRKVGSRIQQILNSDSDYERINKHIREVRLKYESYRFPL